jgi:Protein of unknown function (DUF3572)
MLRHRNKMDESEASAIALSALAFQLADDTRRDRFFAESGALPGQLAGLVRQLPFLTGILDMLLGNERLLLDFCAQAEIEPATVERALRLLSPEQGDG